MISVIFPLIVMDATPKDRCINNNKVRTLNGNDNGSQTKVCATNLLPSTPIRAKDQHQSRSNQLTVPAPEDGSVLKKVISFTFDQMNNVESATEKETRLPFVPERLHFSAYEQFKGEFILPSFVLLDNLQ